MNFTNPSSTPFARPRSRGELPHLYKEGGTYFVTLRLYDAVVPESSRARAARETQDADAFDDPDLLLRDYDPPIQLGSCLLNKPEVAAIVDGAIQYFDQDRYGMVAWCVMPNHVHVIFTPFKGYAPNRILHSWKSYTSHTINKLLRRSGTIWERESFDHLVRSFKSLDKFVRYTEANPVVAGLCHTPEEWPYSSARHTLQGTAGGTPAPQ